MSDDKLRGITTDQCYRPETEEDLANDFEKARNEATPQYESNDVHSAFQQGADWAYEWLKQENKRMQTGTETTSEHTT